MSNENDEWEQMAFLMAEMETNGLLAGTESSIDAETKALIGRLISQLSENAPKTEETRIIIQRNLERIQLNHMCRGGCHFVHLSENERFEHDGRSYVSTGDVYLCQRSGRPHICGERCSEKVLVRGSDECMTCPLTRHVLTKVKQYTLSAGRLEEDIRIIGDLVYSRSVYESEDLKDENNGSETRPLAERLMEITENAKDIRRTCELFGEKYKEIPFEAIKAYLIERTKNRAIAYEVFEVEVLSEEHDTKQREKIMEAHQSFINCANEYLLGCTSQGYQCDLLVLVRLFMQTEFQAYNGIYYGSEPSSVKKQLKSQVVDIILYMWDKVCMLSSVQKNSVSFRNYVLVMLTVMSGSADDYPDGMSVHLKIDEGGKPHRIVEDKLESVDSNIFSVVKVEFIPRIPSLVLAKGTVVQHHKKIRTRKRNARTAFASSSSMFGGETNSACRRGAKSNKTTTRERANGRMPALKILPLIYNDVIKNADSLDSIDEWCVRTVLADTDITVHLKK